MATATANRGGEGWLGGWAPALAALVTLATLPGVGTIPAAGQEEVRLEARIWLDRGPDGVYERGERARVYYHVSESAYVAIFRIDTDGRIDLVYPRSPYQDYYTRGGRDYRLLFSGGRSPYWYVSDDPGLGYYFIVASPDPMDFSTLDYATRGGWDLASVGRQVYRDPYVAIDEYVARLVPDWERTPYALDFAEYNVGRAHDYPRFLCYDCHGYRPYRAWNPYRYHCSSFRVVIYNDPYYYPVYRYRGTRVVFVRPPRPRQPRFVFKERAVGEVGGPVVATRGSVKEAGVPRRVSPKENGAARVEIPRTAPRADVPRRSAGPGELNTGDRSPVRIRPPRRSGSPSSARQADPGASRDPVVVPRLRPSDRLRGRTRSTPTVERRSPPTTRSTPRAPSPRVRPSAPETRRSTPETRRSSPRTRVRTSPPGTRSSPPRVKRSPPRVKKRGGGSVASGFFSSSRSSRTAAPGREVRSSRGESSSFGSVLSRTLRRVFTRGSSSRARSSTSVRGSRASGTRSSVGSSGSRRSTVKSRSVPTVRRRTGSTGSSGARRSPPAKVRKSRGSGGGGG